MIKLGQSAPAYKLPATGDQKFSLRDFKGQHLVVYFYPKDNTPGCTSESKAFRDLHAAFTKLNAAIVGVSRDSIKSHENFKAKLALPFELISDADEKLCQYFGVIREKKLYGRTFMGIERSTFLFDDRGKLVREWRKVRVPGHAEAVLDALGELA